MKKVLGIGNALVDIMTIIKDDSFLETIELPKGSMQLVNKETIERIYSLTSNFEKKIASGGSAANTIYGIGKLEGIAGYIGKINEKDEFGQFFEKDLHKAGVITHLQYSETPTGRAIALVSPDAERTFATYLGAAVELSARDIDETIFSKYDILHIEGYLAYNEELSEKAAWLAKKNKMIVSIDMASYNVIEDKFDFFEYLIKKYINIIFANEQEAKILTQLDPEEAIHKLSEKTEIAIVKIGDKGSLIKSNGTIHTIDAIKVKPLDTTGAGDFYAAGFLYGLSRNFDLYKCGLLGSYLAGKITEYIGAKPNNDVWENIKKDF